MSADAESPPTVKNLLNALDLGSSVAEHDELLQRYFVETTTFRQLVEDKKDIIAEIKALARPLSF
jgi:hypothetical protein